MNVRKNNLLDSLIKNAHFAIPVTFCDGENLAKEY
jgi:hypothetical protein